jgi:dihydroflavonol-4-reductase
VKKIAFVTGAAGFLGRNLLEALRKEGREVHVLLRSGVPEWMRDWPNLFASTGALDDADAVLRAMPEQCDAVFHLAGNTSSWTGDEAAIYRDNVVATQHVIDAALKRSARRLVVTSTLGVFDTRHGRINEQTPLIDVSSRNPYLRTKLQADALLDDAQQHGLSVVRVHPGHILGKHDRTGWVSLFAQAQQNKLGPAPRGKASFCLVSDVAQAHVDAAALEVAAPRYVVATADASYLELFQGVAKRVGGKPVKNTVPGAVIKTIATLSQWQASMTGKKPTITPGLAAILTSDLIATSDLATRVLNIPSTTLDVMLDDAYSDWLRTRQAKNR